MTARMPRLSWFLLTTVLCAATWAAAAGPAEGYVRLRQGDLSALLDQPRSAAREQKIAAIMDQVFDYDELARRSLGDDWQTRSDAEKQEFQQVLQGLVKQAYRKHLDKTAGWDVSFNPTSNVDGGVRVPTVAKHKTDKRKEPVEIDYLLHEIKGQWRVFDVVVEGSSLVNNYHSQFRKIIKKSGYPELISRMKRRLAKGNG